MVAISGDDPVARLARRDQPGADGLLPDVQVHEAADLASLVQFRPAFLHPADEYHLGIHLEQSLFFHIRCTSLYDYTQ